MIDQGKQRVKALRQRWDAKYKEKAVDDFSWFITGAPGELVQFLDGHPEVGGPCLDIGCGAGEVAGYLWSRGLTPSVGFDIAGVAVMEAARLQRAAGTGAAFLVAGAPYFPFRDSAFGFIHDRGCLHTLREDNYAAYALELRRILKPGGCCVLIERTEDWGDFLPFIEAEFSVEERVDFIMRLRKGNKRLPMTLGVLRGAG